MPRASKTPIKSPADLPQRPGAWHLTVCRLSQWVEMDDGQPARPYLTLLADLKSEQVLDFTFSYGEPTLEDLLNLLSQAMLKPARELRQPPHRPEEIVCDQVILAEQLAPSMAEIGLRVSCQADSPIMDALIQMLEEEFGEESEGQGLLNVSGATPEQIGDLFTAAAESYRLEPWIYLSAEQPLKFSIPALNKKGYALIMGNSAVEYGLLIYDSWEDLELAFLNSGDPRPTLPENGLVALSYVTTELMAPEDLEGIKQYGWPVADPEAYPMPMVMFEDQVARPDLATLLTITALLRALPAFAQQLEPDLRGDYRPLTTETSVPVSPDPVLLTLAYPAGNLRRESFPAAIPLDDIDEDEEHPGFDGSIGLAGITDETEFYLDRDVFEGDEEESLVDWQTSSLAASNPALVDSMELIYAAWDQLNPADIVQLARRALEISPDCAEAYLLLADNLAVNIGQVYKYYQKAVAAAERALGAEFIEQYSGQLWQEVVGRPYLRSLAELSRVLWELGRRDEALQLCLKLLDLDREDHVWARYGALHLLLELDRWEDAFLLMGQFHDPQAGWKYTTALLTFQQIGDTQEARARLAEALTTNPNVPEYLTGRKRLPVDPPTTAFPGQKSEAIAYCAGFIAHWRRVPGAIDWLRKESRRETIPTGKTSRHKKGKTTHRR